MINRNSSSKEWINETTEKLKAENKRVNAEIIEKVIMAFSLLESLEQLGLEFIFKGGTSLLLILNKIYRFSIDIDIIVDNVKELDKLDNIREINPAFIKMEKQDRQQSKTINKQHLKFFYISNVDNTEKAIMLDVLIEDNNYNRLLEKEIKSELIISEVPYYIVKVPSVDDILGDKLTAFAPNTTGIPYGVNKELEIIKQLFDIGNLFDEMENIDQVAIVFNKISEKELGYRNMQSLTSIDVLNDIFNTARILSGRGAFESNIYQMLEYGVRTVKDYIFSMSYNIEEAIGSASKAAYLAMLMKYNIKEVNRYDGLEDLDMIEIRNPLFKKFSSIKKFNQEAWFYWCKAIEIFEKNI